jgi:serine/threonine protein kinase HipA of HipAB toxin-antitoxin module
MEDHAMSLIRNGYALPTRRGFLGALFSGLLALALLDAGAASAQQPQAIKQIKLTDKQVQGFIAVSAEMGKLYENADPAKPDPKRDAQAEALAKKNGFAGLAEYDDVSTNISIIMSGIDPQTKKFTEPPEQLKKEIAALKVDKSVPDAEKKQQVAALEASLKVAKPIQFKENIALVTKYFDKLSPLMQG